MTRFDADIRARARALRDELLSEVEDQDDQRYLNLLESIAEADAAQQTLPSPSHAKLDVTFEPFDPNGPRYVKLWSRRGLVAGTLRKKFPIAGRMQKSEQTEVRVISGIRPISPDDHIQLIADSKIIRAMVKDVPKVPLKLVPGVTVEIISHEPETIWLGEYLDTFKDEVSGKDPKGGPRR